MTRTSGHRGGEAASERILITGAAGRAGALLVPRLARPGRLLTLLDQRRPEPAVLADGEDVLLASITDLEAMTHACRGVDAVVHLAGQAWEASFGDVLRLNVEGTRCVLEAAHRAGVSRVVLASSHHAAGFYRYGQHPPGGLPAGVPGRPDSYYGWSKVAGESLGQLYADEHGMDVICVRIGGWREAPHRLRDLALWLSPDDGARLVEACLAAPSPGFRMVWGISRNTRRWFSLAEGEALGYYPKDDAEVCAAALIAEHGEPDFATDPHLNRLGGPMCDVPLGTPR
ncbi:NAD(P)-dependent oxidoreductase [Phytoactinopolyspora alkaliphila]|uniref:NAD(P)-dependent oxidoreductase n=1 Tax=Phytoactinopolyspora alkaliphila TaxID=1783498 RepID=A0A6N9YIT7_9ACTN|nr:NAD(P)-dependent oxidoreductase [Phytoactinopolyspora alkaliphila]NED94926.1 NAD(P)-dependent oxidoreductase [Phytoactinopolyspora alkaliphila]